MLKSTSMKIEDISMSEPSYLFFNNICACYRGTQERPGWCRDPHLPPCAG